MPELDEQLRGAKVGDILTFTATPEGAGPVSFRVLVKDVKEKMLPELTDEWAAESSEFDTVEALRADLTERMGKVKVVQAQLALREKALDELSELVDDDEVPEVLVDDEVRQRMHDLNHRLEEQRIDHRPVPGGHRAHRRRAGGRAAGGGRPGGQGRPRAAGAGRGRRARS